MFACRECEREVNQATEICPYCGADLTEAGLLLRWGVLLALMTAAIWGFLWYILPQRAGDPAARAEARAVEALSDLRGALAGYAAAQGGSYPASLEILGDRARGPAQKALSEGYQLAATPWCTTMSCWCAPGTTAIAISMLTRPA